MFCWINRLRTWTRLLALLGHCLDSVDFEGISDLFAVILGALNYHQVIIRTGFASLLGQEVINQF